MKNLICSLALLALYASPAAATELRKDCAWYKTNFNDHLKFKCVRLSLGGSHSLRPAAVAAVPPTPPPKEPRDCEPKKDGKRK